MEVCETEADVRVNIESPGGCHYSKIRWLHRVLLRELQLPKVDASFIVTVSQAKNDKIPNEEVSWFRRSKEIGWVLPLANLS
jgi:hypothetical protein